MTSIVNYEHEEEYKKDIVYKKGYFVNSKGYKLVCQEWIPKNPVGAVVILHGYADHGQTMLADDARQFSSLGYAAFIFDQQGHGMSEGLQCLVEDFNDLREDSILFIDDIKIRFPNLKRFIYSSSMGGAVGLLVALKRQDIFNGGLILLSPLIKVDDNMIPSPLVVNLLTFISSYFPSLPIVPGENVLDRNIKDPDIRATHASHPLTYKGRVRLGTGVAILKVTEYLRSNLQNVNVPLLILHGGDDKVSSPLVSRELFDISPSTDKSLKIYEGMWHSLTSEPSSHIVYNDIFNWMNDRIDTIQVTQSILPPTDKPSNVNSNNKKKNKQHPHQPNQGKKVKQQKNRNNQNPIIGSASN